MVELFQAHKEWRDRPIEECYPTLAALQEVTQARAYASVISRKSPSDLIFAVNPADGDLVVKSNETGSLAVPTNWAFSQMAGLLKAPAAWCQKVPAALAVQNLNWAAQSAPREAMMMMWANGSNPGVIRCFTSPDYGRLPDWEVVQAIRTLTNDETGGWKRPPSILDHEAPRGYYAGDRNIFIFCVNESAQLDDDSSDGLHRGFFCWNSEVRQMSFGFKAFLYRRVCGNHLVYGAKELFDVRMIHLGKHMAEKAVKALGGILKRYMDSGTDKDQMIINKARTYQIRKTKAEIVDWLQARHPGGAWRPTEAKAIVDQAEELGKDPTILWNLVNAATVISQKKLFTDERTAVDAHAGAMMEVVF